MTHDLTKYEVEVLRILAGQREPEWGAWVSACLEFLSGGGYCTRGPNYDITDKGRAALIRGTPPKEQEERERLLWLLVGIHAGALTPVSENEKRGMERVLAILDRKIAEGGGSSDDAHNRFYRGRWSAFQECALMLRSALCVKNPDQQSERTLNV